MIKHRLRKRDPNLETVNRFAREIWRRDPDKAKSLMREDRRFREFFGCSAVVALSVWRRLELGSLVPDDGTIKHLMWTLLFMKVYPKKEVMCILIQVNDPKTYRKRIWSFMEAIADLAGQVVSNYCFFLNQWL